MIYSISSEGNNIKLEANGITCFLAKSSIAVILPLSEDMIKMERKGAADIFIRWRDIGIPSTPGRAALISTISQWIL